MLLQRIELKGFLSYYGHKNEAGEVEPIVIDFRQSPLWLIHGENGVGKSALFDAITFVLYKQHRGGGSSFYNLVNDATDKAEINLEIELNGQSYLVQRTITRTRRKVKGKYEEGANVWGIVRCGTRSNSPAIPGTENKVEEWVQNNLRMSDKTFVSAVVLRQGEADAFLKARADERRTRLLELLDLNFYKKLGEKATKQRNDWKKKQDTKQEELDGLPIVTVEQLKIQQQAINEVQKLLTQAKQSQLLKKQELDNARNVADYIAQISEKETQQSIDAVLLAKADEILRNIRRYRELKSIFQQLEVLWKERGRLEEEKNRIQQINENVTTLNNQLNELVPQLNKVKDTEKHDNDGITTLTQRLEEFQKRQQLLNNQLNDLKQVLRLEKQITAEEEKLKPHSEVLAKSEEIIQKYSRYEQLKQGVPLLQRLKNATQQIIESEEGLQKAQTDFDACQQQVNDAKTEEETLQKALETTIQEYENLQQTLRNCERQITLFDEKLKHRDSVSHETECPICGSHLDNEEAQSRLEKECKLWQEENSKFKLQQKSINQQLKTKEQDKYEAESTLNVAKNTTRNAEIKLAATNAQLEGIKVNLTKHSKELEVARQEAGSWIDKLNQLPSLEIELQNMKLIAEQKQKLSNAQLLKNSIDETIDNCQKHLEELPKFSPEQREQLPLDNQRVSKFIQECQEDKRFLESEVRELKSKREELENQKRDIEGKLNLAQHQLSELERRKQNVEKEVERQKNALPPNWVNHPACVNEESLETLHTELASLKDSETQESQLHEAQNRVNQLAGAINTLKEQLEKIPVQHHRPVADVKAEIDVIDTTLQQTEEKLNTERQKLSEMNSQKQRYDEQLEKLKEAKKELSYYKRLADAFGNKGLQAKIIQKSQEAIQINANNTLAHLSNGTWQIDLKENEAQTELEILARDLRSTSNPLRQFDYLSGGEKFLVAVSLAVAIGQSISGGRTVDTLVIDEGFGNLDKDKRPLMVSELRRLSEDVLQGGRVIVVSHQEDVCEEFGSKYRVYRDANNHAKIKFYNLES
ncbi:hypothetical protein NIES37_73600 (plasmid) [Tolypothrix tenuis PCC 7101]|uniref:Nuclease SbcCD subunit C n=2 Tax=Tolypothrix TaxID=111782 RepID=A0A1Z4NCA5_9CYAN|nr:hypothetical protein NIES37_73600 [Tolypothrix tenuis PCC 7101]BAZ78744.1 hypothetical protein NIES50_73770 [Aulosira laxa NIES-50]